MGLDSATDAGRTWALRRVALVLRAIVIRVSTPPELVTRARFRPGHYQELVHAGTVGFAEILDRGFQGKRPWPTKTW